jgi:hypothetical protein
MAYSFMVDELRPNCVNIGLPCALNRMLFARKIRESRFGKSFGPAATPVKAIGNHDRRALSPAGEPPVAHIHIIVKLYNHPDI